MNAFRQSWLWVRSNIFWILLTLVLFVFFLSGKTAGSTSSMHRDVGVYRNSTAGSAMPMMASKSVVMDYDMAVSESAEESIAPQMPMPTPAGDFVPEATDRKIIKNGQLVIEVKDTEKTKEAVTAKIQEFKGSITHMNSWEMRTDVLAYSLTLRVPSDQLENFVKIVADMGSKKSENFSTQDITAVYQDTANRLKNLEARRERLRSLMDRETKDLKDVLLIDKELAEVQTEIENLEGVQRGRDTDTAYSILNLTINPEPEIGDFQNPNWSVGKSWTTTINDFVSSVRGIFDRLLWLVVFAPIWGGVLVIVYFVRRWWRKKQ